MNCGKSRVSGGKFLSLSSTDETFDWYSDCSCNDDKSSGLINSGGKSLSPVFVKIRPTYQTNEPLSISL